MYNFKIPNEITQKVQSINNAENKKKKYDDLYSKLDAVKNKFDTSSDVELPNKIELDRMEFNKPTEEEIKKNSETLLSDYKNSEINKIENDYKLKQDELSSNKSDAINTTNETKDKLNSYYDNAKKDAESQAIKRGLGRSSIILNQIDSFNNSEINDYKQLDEKLSSQINAINFELNALNTQKESALKDFDIAYAVKLQEKINSLNEELTKKETEVNKYNNEIAIKEAEYNKSLQELKQKIENGEWDKNTDLLEIYGKYGPNIVEKIKNEEIYNVAKEYLQSLSAEDRNELLYDETFKNKMGSSYEKLLKEFN